MTAQDKKVEEQAASSRLRQIEHYAVHYTALNGFLFYSNPKNMSITVGNLSLTPSIIPKFIFDKSKKYAEILSNLFLHVSRDVQFMKHVLEQMSNDPFINGMKKILLQSSKLSNFQMFMSRSDFMEDSKQVEEEREINCCSSSVGLVQINTVSISLPFISQAASNIQRNLYAKFPHIFPKQLTGKDDQNWQAQGNLAKNYVHLFNIALEKYAKIYKRKRENLVALFVTSPQQKNSFDIFSLENALFQEYNISSLRSDFNQIYNNTHILNQDENCKPLYFKQREVAIVYYRHGYIAQHYQSDSDWQVRKMIEESSAIKCPDIAGQIVGLKIFQQKLGEKKVFDKYISQINQSLFCGVSKQQVHSILKCVCNLSENQNEQTIKCLQCAKQFPEKFVLKSQNEGGGGGNYFGDSIPKAIQELEKQNRLIDYVLAYRYYPKVHKNLVLTQGKLLQLDVIDEIGIYHHILAVKNQDKSHDLVSNRHIGYLIRSKEEDNQEAAFLRGGSIGSILTI